MEASDTGSLSQHVYTGFWVNKAYKSPYGATLTLSRQTGGFLIAFLAIYVGFVGTSVWNIVRFCLHVKFSSRLRPDGIYHQRQVLLKNARTAPEAVVDSFQLFWAWRNRSKESVWRLFSVATVAATVASAFAVASIFSSRVTANDSNEVLLLGRGCNMNKSVETLLDIRTDMRNIQMRLVDYLARAQACYRDGQANQPQQCQTNVRSLLPYTLHANATCPFVDGICRNSSGNVFLESQPLDSFTDLGINHEPRFDVRVNRHCAPLATKGYTTLYTERQRNESITYVRYNYGNTMLLENDTVSNYVYQARWVNTSEAISARSIFEHGFSDYRLRVMEAQKTSPTAFTPIADLNRTDARVMLIFLDQSSILYSNRTEDPWFRATTPANVPIYTDVVDMSFYRPDEPAGVLGCTSQFLLCKHASPSECANFGLGLDQDMEQLRELWPRTADRAAVLGYRIALQKTFQGPVLFYGFPGIPSMLSRFTMSNSLQLDILPSNRWQQELEYTFQAELAALQSGLFEVSTKGIYILDAEESVCPDREACLKLCYFQRIRTNELYSFSVLGVSIIIFLGLLPILIGTFIESIAGFNFRVFDRLTKCDNIPMQYAILEWTVNSPFHLHRLAHEALGLGSWSRTDESVPVPEPDERLGILDISDPGHTRLQARDAGGEELEILNQGHSRRASIELEDQEPNQYRESESLDIQFSSGRYYSQITDADDLSRRR